MLLCNGTANIIRERSPQDEATYLYVGSVYV